MVLRTSDLTKFEVSGENVWSCDSIFTALELEKKFKISFEDSGVNHSDLARIRRLSRGSWGKEKFQSNFQDSM